MKGEGGRGFLAISRQETEKEEAKPVDRCRQRDIANVEESSLLVEHRGSREQKSENWPGSSQGPCCSQCDAAPCLSLASRASVGFERHSNPHPSV